MWRASSSPQYEGIHNTRDRGSNHNARFHLGATRNLRLYSRHTSETRAIEYFIPLSPMYIRRHTRHVYRLHNCPVMHTPTPVLVRGTRVRRGTAVPAAYSYSYTRIQMYPGTRVHTKFSTRFLKIPHQGTYPGTHRIPHRGQSIFFYSGMFFFEAFFVISLPKMAPRT